MNKWAPASLFILGLLVGAAILFIRPYTGYMDADYYFAGAKTLYEGKGFNDYYLWNYLSNPSSLPAPSHTYWMPMASLIALAGMKVFSNSSLWAARSGFILLFAFVPPLMANLSWKTFHRKDWALLSGLYAIFCGYFLKFVTEPDGFVVLFLTGILLIHLLQAHLNNPNNPFTLGLGILVGCIHLTRSDGILWVAMVGGFLLLTQPQQQLKKQLITGLLFLAGYLLVTVSWYARLWDTTGSPFPAGGLKTVFITSYDQLFTYPATSLNFTSWISQGWKDIFVPRINALGLNILSLVVVFGFIVLVPSVIRAAYEFRKSSITQFLVFAGACIFLLMTFAVPLVGTRGGLLHSGAILLPAIWLAAPVGNQLIVARIRSSTGYTKFSEKFYHAVTLVVLILMSVIVMWMDRAVPSLISQANTWNQYQDAALWLDHKTGVDPGRTVIINNPPAYFAATGGQAIVVPYGSTDTILEVARKYHAEFLLLDQNYQAWFPTLFSNQTQPEKQYKFIGEVNGLRVFQLEVSE